LFGALAFFDVGIGRRRRRFGDQNISLSGLCLLAVAHFSNPPVLYEVF